MLKTKYILMIFILLIVLHAHYRRLKQAGSFSCYIRSMLWDPSYDRNRIKPMTISGCLQLFL